MRQPLAVALLVAWLGFTLLLSRHRWFHRRATIERVRPYVHGLARTAEVDSGATALVRVLGPLAQECGAALARFSGVNEDLSQRLDRVHSPLDSTSFRLRQLGWVIASSAVAVFATIATQPPLPLTLLFIIGAPVLAFLTVEWLLARHSDHWKRRTILELPTVSEQLGMLLSAGYSLGASLHRLAQRSDGTVARDLRRVVTRIGHGVDENSALQEWATTVDVPAVARLVGVLALNRDAGDLGTLITNEARAVRAEVHRELVETIEKRGQQVWIPVTVATLVPGLLFLAVPFTEAIRLFSAS